MPGVLVHLDEGALVEEHLDPLARGLLAACVLLLDGPLGPALATSATRRLRSASFPGRGGDVEVAGDLRSPQVCSMPDSDAMGHSGSLSLPVCADRPCDSEASGHRGVEFHPASARRRPGSERPGRRVLGSHECRRQRRSASPLWRVVIADHQTLGGVASAGSGRSPTGPRSRSRWSCPSALIGIAGWLPLLTGLALARAIRAVTAAAGVRTPEVAQRRAR